MTGRRQSRWEDGDVVCRMLMTRSASFAKKMKTNGWASLYLEHAWTKMEFRGLKFQSPRGEGESMESMSLGVKGRFFRF